MINVVLHCALIGLISSIFPCRQLELGSDGYHLLRHVSCWSRRIDFDRPTVLLPVELLINATSSAVKSLEVSSAWSQMKMVECKEIDVFS